MRVLLVRHGAAVDLRSAPTDELRWLSNEGRRDMVSVGETLREHHLAFSRMYTSPLVRAVQTAEVLATTQADFVGPVEIHSALASEHGTIAQALAPLDQVADDEVVVMVTHMPKIEVLAGDLCGTSRFQSFQPGAACLIHIDQGRGTAEWMLDPKTREFQRR